MFFHQRRRVFERLSEREREREKVAFSSFHIGSDAMIKPTLQQTHNPRLPPEPYAGNLFAAALCDLRECVPYQLSQGLSLIRKESFTLRFTRPSRRVVRHVFTTSLFISSRGLILSPVRFAAPHLCASVSLFRFIDADEREINFQFSFSRNCYFS